MANKLCHIFVFNAKLKFTKINAHSVISRVNNIRREYLTPYRAVKYDCVKLKGFFLYNSVIPCILNTHYIIAL